MKAGEAPVRTIVCWLLTLLIPAVAAAGSRPVDAGQRTELVEFESAVLDEQRRMWIRYPERYAQDERRYTVVYVTDGETNFELVAGFLEYLSDEWKRYPDMVVVGLENVDRDRDFVPRADSRFPTAGAGDRFVEFMEKEWIPQVERRVRADGHRVLVGHSFGGVNALNVLFNNWRLFDAYIAIGTSTWVSDRVLFEIANDAFDRDRTLEAWLYLSVAEADGGETVPAGHEFAALLRARAPAGLDWRYEIIPRTTHFSAVPPSLHSAFDQLFPAWGFDRELEARIRAAGPPAVPAWFAEQRARLGYRFHPQDWDLMVLAYKLAREGAGEAALALTGQLQSAFPTSLSMFEAGADVLRGLDRRQQAIAAYERAIEVARSLNKADGSIPRLERKRAQLAVQSSE